MSAIKCLDILKKAEKELSIREKIMLDDLCNRAFGPEEDQFISGISLEWAGTEIHFLGFWNTCMVSHVGIHPRCVRIGSKRYHVAGIGGVATDPNWQRRGFARLLLEATHQWIKGWNQTNTDNPYPLALLFCEIKRIPYYSSFGYQPTQDPVYIHLHGKRFQFTDPCMILPFSEVPWINKTIDLRGKPW